jgi:membrane-associated protease RseP (regulator of RpoE activity)
VFLGCLAAVAVHELGHLTAARHYGLHVISISIGVGPELLGYTDRYGTRWQLAIVPIGGCCKIDFDWESSRLLDSSLAFSTCSRAYQKAAVIYAGGPVFNIFFCLAVYVTAAIYFETLDLWTIDVLNSKAALPMMVSGFSLSLGLFNLLPVLPLDGGRLVLIGLEAFCGIHMDPDFQKTVSSICLWAVVAGALLEICYIIW